MNLKHYYERVVSKSPLITLTLICAIVVSAKVTALSSSDTYAMIPTDNITESSTQEESEEYTKQNVESSNLDNDYVNTRLNTYLLTSYSLLPPTVQQSPDTSDNTLNEVILENTLYFDFHGININVDALMDCYELEGKEEVLNKDKERTIATLSNFFVTQMHVNPTIAAGIFGNISSEGNFGQQQHSYALASNLDEYVDWLNESDGLGYGVVQWTFYTLQDGLVDRLYEVYNWFIEAGYDESELSSGSLFPTVVILAECTYLYDELQTKNLFTDYTKEYSVEDATGRMAVMYERYSNSSKHWKEKDNTYILVSGEGTNSYIRLQNAYKIYEYLLTYLL